MKITIMRYSQSTFKQSLNAAKREHASGSSISKACAVRPVSLLQTVDIVMISELL